MSNNNWKQYGGTYKSFKTFSIGNVVADDVLLRQKYSGEFEILGSITIQQNMISKGIDVGDGTGNNRRQFVQLTAADTGEELHIYTPTKFGNSNTLSTLSTDFITGSTQGIGINTTDISASLHILGRKIPTPQPEGYTESRNHDLIVSSGQSTSSTIVTQNSGLSGIRAISDGDGSKIEFYRNSIYANLNNPGAAITFDNQTNALQFDTEQFSFGDANQRRSFRYAYDTIGNSYSVFNGTALTCKSSEKTFGAKSNTFFDITSSTNNGLALAGGAFPLDPTNESFGIVGIRQNQGSTLSNFQPTYSIISNKPDGIDDHTPIKRTRMGINSYNPKKDYTFSVNGKMRIENGEVNEIAFINIEPNRIVYDFHPSSNYKTRYFTGSTQGVPKVIDDNTYKLVTNTNYSIGDWNLTNIPLYGDIINTKFSVSSYVYYGTNSKFRIIAGGRNKIVFENKLRTLASSGDPGIKLNITDKVQSPYFKTTLTDQTISNFRYVESFLRVPDSISLNSSNPTNDEYLILLFQEDIGLTYMIDFGRMPRTEDPLTNNLLTGGSRIYAKNSNDTADRNNGLNMLYTGSNPTILTTLDISYSDISYSLVTIDTLQDVSINQTIDASNNGERGLFILGSHIEGSNENFGFKHFKNTIGFIQDPIITQAQLIASKFGQSSEITSINSSREYFNMYICKNDRNYMVAVGDNIITYTTNGGTNWNSQDASTILSHLQPNNPSPKLRGLEIANDGSEIFIVGDGTIMYNLDGSSNIANISSWNIIPYDILNINGAGDALTSANSKLIDIHKIDQDNYVVTRDLQDSLFVDYEDSSNREGQISTIHIYVPNLFNRGTSDVLDICGNVLISGDLNFEYTSKLSSSSNKITVATQTNFIIEDALGVNVPDVTAGYNVEISGDISQNGVVHQF